jgi:prephenate dehydratase
MPRRIAIQGYKGCFHEQAARLFYASVIPSEVEESLAVVECDTFEGLYTAKSAAQLAASGEKGVGAVASELAARLYGLDILAAGIETHKQNFTRFLILDDALEVPQAQMDKALLCFTLPHKPGSLAQILTILSFYEMNLTRIQSLPIPGREWQYFFYIDIKFADYLRYTQALAAIRPLLEDLEVLGEYKSAL